MEKLFPFSVVKYYATSITVFYPKKECADQVLFVINKTFGNFCAPFAQGFVCKSQQPRCHI
jgi:hypothetical protein